MEEHKKQFTGWWIPAYVVKQFEIGEINAKELILLATIHSLSHLEQGCFASNEYLGNLLHVAEEQVRRMVAHMKTLDLISQTEFDGRKRWLMVPWDVQKSKGQTPQKSKGQTPQKSGGRPHKKVGDIIQETKQAEKGSLSGVDTPDLPIISPDLPAKKNSSTEWDFKAADELNKVISSAVKVNKRMNRTGWANVFRIMRTRDKIPKRDIGEMIKWYAGHIGGQYDVQAYSAQSFCDKWEKLVAAKMRNENEETKSISNTSKKTSSHKHKMEIRQRVLDWLVEKGYIGYSSMVPSPNNVKAALKALGEKPNAVTEEFVTSGGCEE